MAAAWEADARDGHRSRRNPSGRRSVVKNEEEAVLRAFLFWLILFVLCWPLALLALVLYPIVWVLALPFRLIGVTLEGLFELLRALVLLPARLLGAPVRS